MAHFEVYFSKLGIHHTASPGKDTLHKLIVGRVNNDILPTNGAEGYPRTGLGAYRCHGKSKGGRELSLNNDIDDIRPQWNGKIESNDTLTLSILVANVAHGTESYMEQILNTIEGRQRSHVTIGPSSASTYGLKVAGAETEQAVDEAAAEAVRILGRGVAQILEHGVDHFEQSTKNHDCIVLYDTIAVERPLDWHVGKRVTVCTVRGLAGIKKGNPEYSADIMIKRQR